MYEDTISPSAGRFGTGIRLLFRWKHSVYKLVGKAFIVYILTYIFISLITQFVLSKIDEDRKNNSTDNSAYYSTYKEFVAISNYFGKYTSNLPIALLLGFFTQTAMNRWFTAVMSIAGTAKVISVFILSLKEDLPQGLDMVKEYSRWILLSWTLAYRLICKPLRKLYPDLITLQNSALIQPHERLVLEEYERRGQGEQLPLVVLDWNLSLLKRCTKQNQFNLPADLNRNVDAILAFKKSCGNTMKFTDKNIPFALLQVVSITVYMMGVASLFVRQINDDSHATTFISLYLPFLNVFQYFLYFSWLQFGMAASNPFGEDEDDIDVRSLLQQHIDDALRLQSLYSSGPNDDLVTKSLENQQKNHSWLLMTTLNEVDETTPALPSEE